MIYLSALCVILASASLAAGYLSSGWGIGAGITGAVGLAWLGGQSRRWRSADAVGLAGLVAAAAAGAFLGVAPGWLLTGTVAALSGWDLGAFARWLEDVEPPQQARRLALRHVGWLLIVDAAGLVLAALAMHVRLRLSLPVLLFVGVVLVLGVSQAVRFLRRQAG